MHLRRFPPHHYAERTSGESPRFAKSVVEIPDVMLLNEIWVVSEDGNRRRGSLDLRCVIELHFATCCLGRLSSRNQRLERRVHLRCCDPFFPFRIDVNDEVQQLRNALACESRKKNERDEFEERRFFLAFLLKLVGGIRLFLCDVPLVHRDDQAASGFPCESRNLQILVVKPFCRIDDQYADVGPIDCASRAERRVELDSVVDSRLPTQSRSIDKD